MERWKKEYRRKDEGEYVTKEEKRSGGRKSRRKDGDANVMEEEKRRGGRKNRTKDGDAMVMKEERRSEGIKRVGGKGRGCKCNGEEERWSEGRKNRRKN